MSLLPICYPSGGKDGVHEGHPRLYAHTDKVLEAFEAYDAVVLDWDRERTLFGDSSAEEKAAYQRVGESRQQIISVITEMVRGFTSGDMPLLEEFFGGER
jgi:hypothetical protein